MDRQYRELGQSFRLAQAALEVAIFTVSELESLTGVNVNTIYDFVSKLGDEHIRSEPLPGTGSKGRPRKRYRLTEAGLEMLAARNGNILAAMGRVRTGSTPTMQEVLQQIMKFPAADRAELINQVLVDQAQQVAQATPAAQVQPRPLVSGRY